MKKSPWKTYLFWILLSVGVGALSGWVSRDGMQLYQQSISKPPLSPPAVVFPIVWSILFVLMGISAARVSLAPSSRARSWGLNLFVIQLAVYFLWSPIFFNAQAFGLAFLWLILLLGLVLGMILLFRKVDTLAAWIQIPYLLWLAFAGYLNLGVWYLNR